MLAKVFRALVFTVAAMGVMSLVVALVLPSMRSALFDSLISLRWLLLFPLGAAFAVVFNEAVSSWEEVFSRKAKAWPEDDIPFPPPPKGGR